MAEDRYEDTDGRRIPDFLGIGAQKAGTTWLWQNLRYHRDIYLPRRKELHFLDEHWGEGYNWYLRHFGPRRVGNRLAGEATPSYLVTDVDRIEIMHRINPDMKLLLMVREPVDRAWSAARYFARNQLGSSAEDMPLDEFEALVRSPMLLDRGDYRTGVERWTGVFGSDQLLVHFTDEMVADPAGTFRSVLRFLAVDTDIDESEFDLGTVFNPGRSAPLPARHREVLSELLEPQLRWLKGTFPDRDIAWLR